MRLLLLAGTAEARRVACGLAQAGVDAVASLAGATRRPEVLAVPTRVGGFGGADGFRDFLRSEAIGAVLDATHPFAARISARSAEVCSDLGLPYLYLLRPEWEPAAGDNWVSIGSEEDAAALVPEDATVFLATGRQTLERFANLVGRRVYCRQIDPPEGPFPIPGGEFLVSRPPFPVEDEVELFRRLGIDWLVAKNSGGAASRTKLDAARALGLPVAMIRRPAPPDAPSVETVEEAMDWVRGLG